MIFAKDLLLKGAAGLALCAGVGAGGWYVITQNNKETLETLTKAVGIECTNENSECTLKSGVKLKLKKSDSSKGEYDIASTNSNSGAKIKLYKGSDQASGYENEFKFVIEGGDISVTSGTTPKLEEFETYEIVKDGNTWYLTRKDESFKGIRKALGLPEDCNAPTSNDTESTCALTVEKIKLINFEGKGTEITVDSPEDPAASLNLKITSTEERTQYPLGYKFTLESNKNITLNGTTPAKTIKKDTNTEFKIKPTAASDGGARTLSLEKFWTPSSLGNLVGLTCPTGENEAKECTLGTANINVDNGENNKYKNTSKGSDVGTDKKVKFEIDQENFNQGIRFYVEEGDISLDGGEAVNGSGGDAANKKIEQKGSTNVFYEVKKGTGGDTNWYLTKKPVTVAA